MLKNFLQENGTNYTQEIINGNYSFFSVVSFFGFDDGIRLIQIIYIIISFILNLIIFVILCKRKNKKYSIALQLNSNLLIINFIHTFAYLLNWVVKFDQAHKIWDNGKSYDIGGLLIGNPKNHFGMCLTQGFLLIFSSMSQDMFINIFFYIINKSSIITKKNLTLLCYSLGYFCPFLYALIHLIFGFDYPIQQSEDSNLFSIEDNFDSFDDFNNKKIKLEKNELIGFNAKAKECNMLYELNNNGEVDNGMLINSKINTISSSSILNNSQHSYYSRSINNNNIDDEDENEEFNIKDLIDNEEKLEIKKNNVYEQMKLLGYEKEYVKKCVDENILCHASVVFFLLMNYDK